MRRYHAGLLPPSAWLEVKPASVGLKSAYLLGAPSGMNRYIHKQLISCNKPDPNAESRTLPVASPFTPLSLCKSCCVDIAELGAAVVAFMSLAGVIRPCSPPCWFFYTGKPPTTHTVNCSFLTPLTHLHWQRLFPPPA